jgi:hypothetical protein
VIFPTALNGVLTGDFFTLQVDNGGGGHIGTQPIHSTAIADFNGGADPVNLTDLQSLANQIGADWLAWRLASLELRYESAVDWDIGGMEDVEWLHGPSTITTAVYRSTWEPEQGTLQHAPSIGETVPPDQPAPPTITDPAGGVATGPPFKFTSKDGTVGIQASQTNPGDVDFSAAFGPMMQLCLQGCSGPICVLYPAQWYLGAGPCFGSGIPPVAEQWYCLQAPNYPGSGPGSACGPCAVTLGNYCVAYPSFNPDFADFEGCDVFAAAGYQTVSLKSPCVWIWQQTALPCAITFEIVGTAALVQFGNGPYEQQLGLYKADIANWDCLTTPLVLTLTDPVLWPNSPASVTVYPGACPPPIAACGPCATPPEFVCLSVPGLTQASGKFHNAECGFCAALGAGFTLTCAPNFEIAPGVFTCGWTAIYGGGDGCRANPVTLYWNPTLLQWVLSIGAYPVIYTAATWNCTGPLTLALAAAGNPLSDCAGWPSTVTLTAGPCYFGSGSGVSNMWYCLLPPNNMGSGSGSGTCTVATPTFSPAAGSYGTAQTVAISCATVGAAIYYTTDGSTPTGASAFYTAPINVAASETVKAIALLYPCVNSGVGSAAYVISGGGGGITRTPLGTASGADVTEVTLSGVAVTGDLLVAVGLGPANASTPTVTFMGAPLALAEADGNPLVEGLPNSASVLFFQLSGTTGTGDIVVTVNGGATPTDIVMFATNVTGPSVDPAFSAGENLTSTPALSNSGATSHSPGIGIAAILMFIPVGSAAWINGFTAGQSVNVVGAGSHELLLVEGYIALPSTGDSMTPALDSSLTATYWGGIGGIWY